MRQAEQIAATKDNRVPHQVRRRVHLCQFNRKAILVSATMQNGEEVRDETGVPAEEEQASKTGLVEVEENIAPEQGVSTEDTVMTENEDDQMLMQITGHTLSYWRVLSLLPEPPARGRHQEHKPDQHGD